nr:unnamed protein product [Callosobruchus analis]
MTYLNSWEDFEKEAERLYLQSPWKVRYTMKYVHSKNQLVLKMTDDVVVIFTFSVNTNIIKCCFFSVCSSRLKSRKTFEK